MSMTKKDYDLIGEALVKELQVAKNYLRVKAFTDKEYDDQAQAIKNVGYRLNGLLANQDPKFDEYKFKQAWEKQ